MNAPGSITITPVRVADLIAEGERMPVYVHVIDHPDARVLVDTGMTELHPAVADLDPRLRPLSKQDFDLAGIDIVVNTHLHFDHCGGNHLFAGRPIYGSRNARFAPLNSGAAQASALNELGGGRELRLSPLRRSFICRRRGIRAVRLVRDVVEVQAATSTVPEIRSETPWVLTGEGAGHSLPADEARHATGGPLDRDAQRFEVVARPAGMLRHGSRLRLGAALAIALLLVSACGGDGAGAYPERQITFVVPFAAGGPTDTVTRLIAEPMSEALGQQIVVQNVEGAGGTVAAGQVANAEPDGYTVLMHHIGMSTAPTLYPDLSYDPLEDFKTIGLVTEVPMTIIGQRSLEPDPLEELVDYVTENADSVTYAHAGIGAASHLCGLLFQNAADVKLTEVPYDGTGPALTDLVGGQVDFMCDQTTNTTGQIEAGEVKAYAVTTEKRLETFPDLPTTAQAGLPDVQLTVWHGLYVPAETTDDVVQALSEALAEALADANVKTRLDELGTAPVAEDQATPEALREKLQSQIDVWRPIIEEAG
jgi:tripartite-type tricarboxylate transporter receptor subunit TctC